MSQKSKLLEAVNELQQAYEKKIARLEGHIEKLEQENIGLAFEAALLEIHLADCKKKLQSQNQNNEIENVEVSKKVGCSNTRQGGIK